MREIGDRRMAANCLLNLGLMQLGRGEIEQARTDMEDSLRIFQELGDHLSTAFNLVNLGLLVYSCGEYERAIDYWQQSYPVLQRTGDQPNQALVLVNIGRAAYKLGEGDMAREHVRRGLQIALECQAMPRQIWGMVSAIPPGIAAGQPMAAAEWAGLILAHDGADEEDRGEVKALLDELENALGTENLEQAMARGAALDLTTAVKQAIEILV
jgi:tetratricopeptide (TPR) repeat protein